MSEGAGRRYELADGWGRPPGDETHLDVADVAIDARQRVLLLTRFPASVLIYEPDGTLAATWRGGVLSDRPHSVTAGPGGLVYVVDEPDHAIKVFRDGGQLDRVIGTRGVPSATGVDWTRPSFREIQQSIRAGAPPFNSPTALAVGPEGELYVSDGYGNARIHQFSPAGELIRSWGEPGTGAGQFRVPHSVFAATDGRVFVADREGDRIQVFSREGEYLAEWTDVQRPTAITVGERGWLYVTELAWLPGDYSWRRGDITAVRPGPADRLRRPGDGHLADDHRGRSVPARQPRGAARRGRRRRCERLRGRGHPLLPWPARASADRLPHDPEIRLRVTELPDYDSLPAAEGRGRSGWGLFGEQDNVGLFNLQTPDRVADACRLVRTGQVFSLDIPLDFFPPGEQPGERGAPRHVLRNFGQTAFDDSLDGFFLQGTTQWDALGHVGFRRGAFYNGASPEDIEAAGATPSTTGPGAASRAAPSCWTWCGPWPSAARNWTRSAGTPSPSTTWRPRG